MKNTLSKILLFLILIASVYAGAFIQSITARSDGENIIVEWKTGEETSSLSKFVVERKTPHNGFVEIGTVTPKGSNSFYTFVDNKIFKGNDYIFTYRLKIVDNNSQVSYSSEVSVSHSISGVKRTWGSIKAMFR
ncbi:MAG: hypothetical protein ACUVRG_11785 [Ignavibacterium sp.]|uniref:hypothetical protein n=1 Tax=Ignavibacterium sp. TaxID=2651167 RepID=UPI00404B702E